MSKSDSWIGVDYGSKLAGTTVVCYQKNDKLFLEQSVPKNDADEWLSEKFAALEAKTIFLDAPLSLPKAYTQEGENFFYRQCDKDTNAMSPMFLGGLTARAMRLKHKHSQLTFHETYPGYLIRTILNLKNDYTKRKAYNSLIEKVLLKQYKLRLDTPITNWHQLDAFACWISGLRSRNGDAIVFGDKEEGLITI